MNDSTHVPYTYFITWSSTGMKYYGVRYAMNCNPSELWVGYFTSSTYVAEYRKIHGEPDILLIRKQFFGVTKVEDARAWEYDVLRKLKVIGRGDYLNKSSGRGIPPMFGDANPMRQAHVREKHLEIVSSTSHRDNLKLILNTPEARERNRKNQIIAQNRPEVKAEKSRVTTERFLDDAHRKKHKNGCNTTHFKDAQSAKIIDTIWMNNGICQKYIKPNDVAVCIENGWVMGMLSPSPKLGKRLMNNGILEKFVHPDNIDNLKNEGWALGRIRDIPNS